MRKIFFLIILLYVRTLATLHPYYFCGGVEKINHATSETFFSTESPGIGCVVKKKQKTSCVNPLKSHFQKFHFFQSDIIGTIKVLFKLFVESLNY